MADHPLRSATHRCLGRPLPYQLANGTRAHPLPIKSLTSESCDSKVLCGISSRFQLLFPCKGQVAHALLTRPPLSHSKKQAFQNASLDLHVLGTPPAFVLSQDQTLDSMVTVRACFFSVCLSKSAFASLKPLPIHQVLPSDFALPSPIYTSHPFQKNTSHSSLKVLFRTC